MKERKNSRLFRVTGGRVLNVTPTKGECDKIRTRGVTTPYFRISLILLWLSLVTRPPLRRRSRIGEDDSDPPQK